MKFGTRLLERVNISRLINGGGGSDELKDGGGYVHKRFDAGAYLHFLRPEGYEGNWISGMAAFVHGLDVAVVRCDQKRYSGSLSEPDKG